MAPPWRFSNFPLEPEQGWEKTRFFEKTRDPRVFSKNTGFSLGFFKARVFSKRGFFQNMIIAQLSICLLIQITNWKYVLTWFLNDVNRITIITVNIS